MITAVNILGGLTIGVLQQGMTLAAAAQTYTLLTVGGSWWRRCRL
ncbi:MAG: FHIPEP family type III secretion protein [Nitrospiraceae bacterium]